MKQEYKYRPPIIYLITGIPGRWKERRRLNFRNIVSIGEFHTYDHVIEIMGDNGTYLIEKKWMRKVEFEILRNTLSDLTEKITHNHT